MIASAGDSTASKATLNGLAPVSSNRLYCAARAAYLANNVIWLDVRLEVPQDREQIAQCLDLGDLVERHGDVEFVLNLHDEIHHRHGIEPEIIDNMRLLRQ